MERPAAGDLAGGDGRTRVGSVVPSVSELTWDGNDLLAALRHAAGALRANVAEVNALNVFPVPDGDTGSNMLATVLAAIEEAEEVPTDERTVPRIAAAISLGALMGARGNSGVILSQLFRGLSESVNGATRIGGRELAAALDQGCTAAFASVAHPVEGTILTVARDVAKVAAETARSKGSLESVLAASVEEAAASVSRTPDLLPVLEQAGVVDAGGRGLELLLRGALAQLRGEPVPHVGTPSGDIALPDLHALEADGYGYETVFVVTPHPGTRLSTVDIKRRLDELGESVLVAGDERAVKVHVHNERPDEIIAYGLSLGVLSRIGVENLDRQASQIRDRVDGPQTALPSAPEDVAAPPVPVVAVVPGDGLARVFRTLGAMTVIQGGQGANPSAGELADAILATGEREVIVLPNNPNVRLAARQAGQLCPDVRVEIVPTRNAAEGVAALLAFDLSKGLANAVDEMSRAVDATQTLQVTVAVRHARIGRRRVRHGDYIVLGPSDGLVAAGPDRTEAISDAVGKFKPGFELLTIYRGQGVDHAAAEHLRAALRTQLEGIDIELVDGGQPHYDFIISAE